MLVDSFHHHFFLISHQIMLFNLDQKKKKVLKNKKKVKNIFYNVGFSEKNEVINYSGKNAPHKWTNDENIVRLPNIDFSIKTTNDECSQTSCRIH